MRMQLRRFPSLKAYSVISCTVFLVALYIKRLFVNRRFSFIEITLPKYKLNQKINKVYISLLMMMNHFTLFQFVFSSAVRARNLSCLNNI